MEIHQNSNTDCTEPDQGAGCPLVDLADTRQVIAAEDRRELDALKSGGKQALADLFSRNRERLRRMVAFRLDRRLWGRLDASDILQESYLQASRRLADFLCDPSVPVFIWLRTMTTQVLVDVHRRHLGRKKRDARLDVRLHRNGSGSRTSISLASRLIADLTSPSRAAMREELRSELHKALEGMDPVDREVLALRHFENLTNGEVAHVLGLQKSAASNRYVRALKRFREILNGIPTFRDKS